MKGALLLSAVLTLSPLAQAGEHKEHAMHASQAASKEFETLKTFAGDWKGEGEMEGKKMPVTTSFRVTSGGSAVVETMGAGTENEMTNVYHVVDGRLMMTHYCAFGNAPQMKLTKAGEKWLGFETVKANGIDPKKTPHMHALVYEMPDKDHLTGTWTSANMGKEHEAPGVFNYSRVGGK